MQRHCIEYYEAFDGTLFRSEYDCYTHEYQLLYEKSGYRFYKDGLVLSVIPDNLASVDSWDYYTLDETKVTENEEFVKYGREIYGYLLGTGEWPPPNTDNKVWPKE